MKKNIYIFIFYLFLICGRLKIRYIFFKTTYPNIKISVFIVFTVFNRFLET